MPRPRAFNEAEVLEKARDLFWKQGYAATSILDLEEALGIKRSSLYHFFGDKRQLFERTLTNYQRESVQNLRAYFQQFDDLREALEAFFSRAVHQATSDPDCKGCFVVNVTAELAAIDTELFSFVRNNRQVFESVLIEVLERARHRGQLAPDADLRALADYLFVLNNGLNVVVKTGIEPAALRAAIRTGIAGVFTPPPSK